MDNPAASGQEKSRPELLHHRLQGSGSDTILTLNGGMMTHGTWSPVTAQRLEHFRVLGCDFRGQLMTPGLGYESLDPHADDVIALLDALSIKRVHILGTSFGGEVGVLLAARHPERVKTLAVITSVDRTPPGMRENALEMKKLVHQAAEGGDATPFHRALIRDVYSPRYLEEHREQLLSRQRRPLAALWFRGLLNILTAIENFDLGTELSLIRCPTLVVHAANDSVMPLERVRALVDAIEGAEMHVHPFSGHALVLEDPVWLSQVYGDFLTRHSRGD